VTVPALVDHLFRHEAARMTATLARILGPGHIELVEDVVQEALLAALARWPRDGIPANPTAWLVQVAKHRALDVLRRERLAVDRDTAIREEIARWSDRDDMAIADDPVLRLGALLLRHPALARPTLHAPMALFHLHAARFAARADGGGDLLLLADQDRSRWDEGHIAAGVGTWRGRRPGTR
jgi:predicted RNA polymerase sigma factor